MIQKVESIRNEMKPDYYVGILVHVKDLTTFQTKIKGMVWNLCLMAY